ncbi:MAG: S8 family serine peptidase [Phycisphaerales bacterium JB039]
MKSVIALFACAGLAIGAAGATDAAPQPGASVHPDTLRVIEQLGGEAKVWVMFSDKGLAPAELPGAIASVAAAYNPRAIERRRLRGTGPLFDESDLPVAQRYVDAVRGLGADVRIESRWLNAISATMTADQARAIAQLPFVRELRPVNRGVLPDVEIGPAPGFGDGPYGLAEEQLTQINLIALHDMGYQGEGIIVGVLDTGFRVTHDAFNGAKPLTVLDQWDFVGDDPVVDTEPGDPSGAHSHGTLILGTLAAYAPGDYIGSATDAEFILCRTEDIGGEYPQEEDFYVAGLEFIEAGGGDVATSSLGYIDWYTQADLDGKTAVTTIGVNKATAKGMVCCTAAGNEGHDSDPKTSHLLAPADALQVFAAGAVRSSGEISGFSSDGPSADGRIKPEVLARGSSTATIDPYSSTGYDTASGTSLSTPLVAGAMICLVQARPTATVDELRDAVFTTASEWVATGSFDPEYVRGYGIIDAAGAAAALDTCYPDCNGDGILDLFDFLCFQNQFGAGEPEADCNGDGILDLFDFLCFQNEFAAGCP